MRRVSRSSAWRQRLQQESFLRNSFGSLLTCCSQPRSLSRSALSLCCVGQDWPRHTQSSGLAFSCCTVCEPATPKDSSLLLSLATGHESSQQPVASSVSQKSRPADSRRSC